MVETVLTLPVKVKNNNEVLDKNQLQWRRYLHKSIPISGKLWQTLTSTTNLLTVKIDHNEEMYFCFISMAFWDDNLSQTPLITAYFSPQQSALLLKITFLC